MSHAIGNIADDFSFIRLDLGDISQSIQAAEEFLSKETRLDILVGPLHWTTMSADDSRSILLVSCSLLQEARLRMDTKCNLELMSLDTMHSRKC